MRRLQPQLIRLAVCLSGAAVLLSVAALGDGSLALLLAPAFLVALPLVFGRYLGEDKLVALRMRRAPRLRPARAVSALPRSPRRLRIAGGLLVARRLAGRAPPVAARMLLLPA